MPPCVAPNDCFFKVSTFDMSAAEHGVIEQLQGNTSASTVKTLYLANANNQKLILGTSANSSTVDSLLAAETINPYTAAERSSFGTLLANGGNGGVTILMPSGKSIIDHWTGYGYAY